MHVRSVLAALILVLALSGCARQPGRVTRPNTAPTLYGDPAHPSATEGWLETRLYFGLGPADQPGKGVSEADWLAFLDREVTPRFPDGLSVLNVYGQWRSKNQTSPERLRSKCLIISYPDTAENREKVESIRAAWKQKTGTSR